MGQGPDPRGDTALQRKTTPVLLRLRRVGAD